MKINYGILAKVEDSIVHFCGYHNKPTPCDLEVLKNELITNEQYALKDYADQIVFEEAKDEFVDYMKRIIFKTEDESN